MSKEKSKSKKLVKVDSDEPNVIGCVAEEPNDERKENIEADVKEKDIRTVTITVNYYENIVALYPTADIQAKCRYLDKSLGETNCIPITDDTNLPLDEGFSFKINVNSKKDTDNLISSPALLTVLQYSGTCDPNIYEQLQKSENLKSVSSVKSFDSIVSIYEAFTGDTVDREILDTTVKKTKAKAKKADKSQEKKTKEKSSKGSKQSKNTKPVLTIKKQKKKKSSETSLESAMPSETKPVTYGMAVIDFLPLFYGKSSYTESLIINPIEKYTDERMPTYKSLPKMTVTVSIDKEICYPYPVILNVTLENIYNTPLVMKSDMDYKICAMLPMENSVSMLDKRTPREPIIFTSPTLISKPHENMMKCWPGIRRIGAEANTTRYTISEDEIKNTTSIEDLNSCINGPGTRLRFNTLKRNLLLKEGMEAFSHQISTNRKILLEIYIAPKEKSRLSLRESQMLVGRGGNSTISLNFHKGKGAETGGRKKSAVMLHLMTVVDVSALLYPGVSKIRVASPVTTFSYDEALEVGVTDSYFVPRPVETEVRDTSVAEPEAPKVDKKSEKPKKVDKSSTSKSAKSAKKTAPKIPEEETKDLKYLLPSEPVPPPKPEKSTLVYNENGKPCFVVLEIELSEPIFKKRNLEDLNNALQELLQDKKQSNKVVLNHHLKQDFYREVLTKITKDIYEKYKRYVSSKEHGTVAEKDFIKYLGNIGAYQTYLSSIKEAVSLLTATKFPLDEVDQKNSLVYQNFISDVFVYLVSEMNDTLNRLICSGLEPVVSQKPKPPDRLLIYAKEAAALGKKDLADRYFIERICYDDSQNPNSWFDYGVFNLEIKEFDKAYECALEALAKKPTHRYSLLLLGAMLANRGQKDEAETCLLNLLVHEPRWVEGWVALYLFYQKFEIFEGMDMAMDMVKKYVDDERTTSDYFNETEELVWTSKICPKTMFFRTAILMLKMRLYDWVEMALAHEIQQNLGITHYLLSAVCLYQELNEQALEHIQHAKAYCVPNYAVCAMSGHCLFALGRHYEAREEYYHVLYNHERPNEVHMVYVNCAQIMDKFGHHQEARKMILLACKYCPTHYTWFRAGQLYLLENDLLSAEECFSEANFRDNRCSEYWGYLTLINLRLQRINEAELCYSQAKRNNLDEEMHERIKKEFEKLNTMPV